MTKIDIKITLLKSTIQMLDMSQSKYTTPEMRKKSLHQVYKYLKSELKILEGAN
tara:strand:+ start:54 stop:215 length:162 start_codon:yes stop_codon:yes gene_type:complete